MGKKVEKRVCSVEGCNGKVHGKGLCLKHYNQERRRDSKKCSIDGCDNKARRGGMCDKHYMQFSEPKDEKPTVCIVEGCDCAKILAKGMCTKHYKQMYRHGKIIKTIYEPNEVIYHDDYAEIILRNKQGEDIASTMVDLEDVDLVMQYHWCLSTGHVLSRQTTQSDIWMHRLILGVDDSGVVVDHINRDGLDNRRSNLRVVTPQQNSINRSIQGNNTSGTPGVNFRKDRNKWRAFITVDGKQISLGMYENKDDAIKARKAAEEKYFGEFAPK